MRYYGILVVERANYNALREITKQNASNQHHRVDSSLPEMTLIFDVETK